MTTPASLDRFHPLVGDWFAGTFDAPTPPQEFGWPAIALGRHALVCAPTGSGKTLAAFLWAIDGLVRSAMGGELEDRTSVVYVSPLKALSNDIQKNLWEPLRAIRQLAEERGTPLPEIRVAVRTGDTPAKERESMRRRPPHILITTPESLYILLTVESSRRYLASARTVIVDVGHGRDLDLRVEVPDQPLGAVASHAMWAEVYDRIATHAKGVRTTIVFVNTRKLVERVAYPGAADRGHGCVARADGARDARPRPARLLVSRPEPGRV
jgi:Lhr-like helicase